MIDYIRLLKTGVMELAVHSHMKRSKYRKNVHRVLGQMRAFLASSFEAGEIEAMGVEMRDAVSEFQRLFPKKMSTITLHMIGHLDRAVRRFGPLNMSDTLWGERFVRLVRQLSSMHKRTVKSLSGGYCRYRSGVPTALVSATTYQEKCAWWLHEEDEEDVCDYRCKLSSDQRIQAALAAGIPMSDNVRFVGGEGLKYRSCYFKTDTATTRIDARYTYHWCSPTSGSIAKIHKIVGCEDDNNELVYVALVTEYDVESVATEVSIYVKKIVDLSNCVRRMRWVNFATDIRGRQPALIPQLQEGSSYLFKADCYDVCVAGPDDGTSDVND